MSKKILFTVMTVVLALGLIGAGAFAYFSDTETSTSNTFEAGTCNIELSAGSSADAFLTADKMKPGDSTSGTIIIENTGTVDIKYLPMGCEFTSGEGTELAAYLNVDYMEAFWHESAWSAGAWDWGTGNYASSGARSKLLNFCNNRYNCDPCDDCWMEASTFPNVMNPGDKVKIDFTITFPENYNPQNDAQGDSVTIKFTFAGYTDYQCP